MPLNNHGMGLDNHIDMFHWHYVYCLYVVLDETTLDILQSDPKKLHESKFWLYINNELTLFLFLTPTTNWQSWLVHANLFATCFDSFVQYHQQKSSRSPKTIVASCLIPKSFLLSPKNSMRCICMTIMSCFDLTPAQYHPPPIRKLSMKSKCKQKAWLNVWPVGNFKALIRFCVHENLLAHPTWNSH